MLNSCLQELLEHVPSVSQESCHRPVGQIPSIVYLPIFFYSDSSFESRRDEGFFFVFPAAGDHVPAGSSPFPSIHFPRIFISSNQRTSYILPMKSKKAFDDTYLVMEHPLVEALPSWYTCQETMPLSHANADAYCASNLRLRLLRRLRTFRTRALAPSASIRALNSGYDRNKP
jgi:hypothetical protein